MLRPYTANIKSPHIKLTKFNNQYMLSPFNLSAVQSGIRTVFRRFQRWSRSNAIAFCWIEFLIFCRLQQWWWWWWCVNACKGFWFWLYNLAYKRVTHKSRDAGAAHFCNFNYYYYLCVQQIWMRIEHRAPVFFHSAHSVAEFPINLVNTHLFIIIIIDGQSTIRP